MGRSERSPEERSHASHGVGVPLDGLGSRYMRAASRSSLAARVAAAQTCALPQIVAHVAHAVRAAEVDATA